MGALKPLSFLLRVRSYRGQWLRLDTSGYPEGFSCSVLTPFLCVFPVHEPSFSPKQPCRGWMTWLGSVVLANVPSAGGSFPETECSGGIPSERQMQELFRMGQGWGMVKASCLNKQGAQAHEVNKTVWICVQAESQEFHQ